MGGPRLEGQLDLTVMVAFVSEHVLEQEDRVVVVKVHVPACYVRAVQAGMLPDPRKTYS